MLATKNPCAAFSVFAAAVALLWSGCSPSGPGLLLDGEAALRDGKTARAEEMFKRVVQQLPDEARGWNFLGLAYHQSGQRPLAEQAYRQALARDRSNLVNVAHFNLGCVLLEQGNASGAADELRSFTMISNAFPVAWRKLGEAQLRLRQFDAAERSLLTAYKLQPKDPATYNDLGVYYSQRGRMRDAVQYINAATQLAPAYAPAQLNAGIIASQSAASRGNALQHFRDYLAADPRSLHATEVASLVRQLEAELAPKPPVLTNVAAAAAPASAKSNPAIAVPSAAPSNVSTVGNGFAGTSPARAVPAVTNPPTRPEKAAVVAVAPPATTSAPPVKVASVDPLRTPLESVPATVTSAPAVAPAPVAAPVTNKPAPPAMVAAPVTVVEVKPQAPIHMAAAASPQPEVRATQAPVESNAGTPAPAFASTTTITDPAPVEITNKPGLFKRFNPFRKSTPAPVSYAGPAVVPSAESSGPAPAAAAAAAVAPKVWPRYTYINPARPAEGDSAKAQRSVQQGVKAERSGRTNEALQEFQLAAATDPSLVEAQYNLALLTMRMGRVKESLALWEMALAVEPESINSRYNFALALKQAGHAVDAAAELEKLLEAKPGEARAHLMLANLCAQQLGETSRARDHYRKVLELDPHTPQAASIRFWLAANP
jgi:Flp pilus assembly protein TadD